MKRKLQHQLEEPVKGATLSRFGADESKWNSVRDTFGSQRRRLRNEGVQIARDSSKNATLEDSKVNALAQEAIMLYPELFSKDIGISAAKQHSPGILGRYPVTSALLWIVHILYFVQWKRSRRRRRIPKKLTYRTLVEKKQFYKWWSALLSQYYSVRNEGAREHAGILSAGEDAGRLSVAMGHSNHENTFLPPSSIQYWRGVVGTAIHNVRDKIPDSWLESPTAHRLRHRRQGTL